MNDYDTLKGLLERDRSIRQFDESARIGEEVLRHIVGLTRLCASGRNLQPLRYRIVSDAAECERVFPLLKWAGYYKDWDGPEEGKRPAAYIVQCLDTRLTANPLCDEGLQLQAISLAATSLGLGGCIIKSFNVPELVKVLDIPSGMSPSYVYALGVPAEKAVITDAGESIIYYRDADGTQCVPKRPLEDIII